MEKPNFNSQEYREDLAKDLREIRKTDPEMAQKVLEEEQNTTRYKIAKAESLEKKPELIELIEDIKNSIKEKNYKNFYEYKKRLENFGIPNADIADVVNFSHEELHDLAKQEYLHTSGGYVITPPPYREGTTDLNEQLRNIKDFFGKLGYKPTPEDYADLFQSMVKKIGVNTRSYEFFMGLGLESLPIDSETAMKLAEQRNYIFWNDKEIFDKIEDPKAKGDNWKEYYEEKYKELENIFKKAENIYLYQQHSYYSYVRLGDKIPEKKKDKNS